MLLNMSDIRCIIPLDIREGIIKMKRKFALVLSIMALCVLSACDINNAPSDSTVTTSAASKSESASSKEQQTPQNSQGTQEVDKETGSSASSSDKSASSKAESSNAASKEESGNKPDASGSQDSSIPKTNITFDNSYAFFGNSIIGDLASYDVADDADIYSYVGLNVSTAFDQKVDGHKETMLNELISKKYKTIFIMFGMNELGWSYPEIFVDNYSELIDTIHEALPDADINLISVTPITKSQEKKKDGNINMKRINEYNKKILNLAKSKNVKFLDVSKYLADENGYLPENDSPDGLHLQPDCSLKFVNAIKYLSTK